MMLVMEGDAPSSSLPTNMGFSQIREILAKTRKGIGGGISIPRTGRRF